MLLFLVILVQSSLTNRSYRYSRPHGGNGFRGETATVRAGERSALGREAVQLREAAVCVLRDLRCTACAAEVRLHVFPFFVNLLPIRGGLVLGCIEADFSSRYANI